MINQSQKQILKATSIIGGSQFLSIIISIVRTKTVAILLGPLGIGIIGLFQSIIDLVRNLTGFGLNYSAVKDVASADISDDKNKINETITVLRSLVLWTGLLGTFIAVIFSKFLGEFTFGNSKYTLSIACLSITLFFTSISGGQMALLQGKREIKLMAKANLFSAICYMLISILIYYLIGINGIIPVLIITSLISLLFSWFYTKKIKYKRQNFTFRETFSKGFEMTKLGFFIVVTSFISILSLYLVRVIIIDKMDIAGVGFFQASWMISTTYVGIILNSMLADFFPRLSSIHSDNNASNKLINEQLEIALVLGTPMILVLMGLAKFVVQFLYSSSFVFSELILQWQLLGAFFTLIAWPLGVLFLAKNKGMYSVITDGIWSILFLVIVYFGWNYLGFLILGIGDFIAIVFKLLLVLFFVNKIGNFKFSNQNIKNIIYFGLCILFMMVNVLYFKGYIQYIITLIIIISGLFRSFNILKKIININFSIFNLN